MFCSSIVFIREKGGTFYHAAPQVAQAQYVGQNLGILWKSSALIIGSIVYNLDMTFVLGDSMRNTCVA